MKTEVNKMTKQPSYRFVGFEDEWKEVKVSDIFRVTRGQVLATTEISEEKTDTHKYPVYSSQTKNEGLLGYYDKYLFETAITWTTDGANAGTVNYREGKFYSTNVNGVLLSDEGFANKAIAEILNNKAWKYVSKVGNPKLMNNVMSGISLTIPNDFREISTLSTFFQYIDQLISLQQRKLEVLKEQKKTYLKLLFPAKGQTKPSLRFAGFEDEWKEVKLGEVTDIKTGGRDVQDSVEDGLYPFYIRSEEVKRINSYSFDGEAILIPGEGRLGEIFHYANGKFDVHQRVYKISNFTDVNAKFVLQQMKKDFKQHAMRNTVKATVDSLRLPTIQSFNILVPSLPEQTAIGSFFQDLDKAIAKQEEKVNQLKESKRTFLKKMFI